LSETTKKQRKKKTKPSLILSAPGRTNKMAHRRRAVGIAGLTKQAQHQQSFKKAGTELEAIRVKQISIFLPLPPPFASNPTFIYVFYKYLFIVGLLSLT
jgi:hypothetical protein